MGTVVSASKRKGGGKKKMLFMAIFTWEPEKGDEVIKRRATEKILEGIKMVGEWKDLGRGRVFRLFEATDPTVILAMSSAWCDLGKTEFVPVIETEEVLKLLPTG
jgi:hypothetical protein